MTTDQLSLLQGDLLSQHRFVLQAVLEDALRLVRTAAVDGQPASRHDVDRALEMCRTIAGELAQLPQEDPIPF